MNLILQIGSILEMKFNQILKECGMSTGDVQGIQTPIRKKIVRRSKNKIVKINKDK